MRCPIRRVNLKKWKFPAGRRMLSFIITFSVLLFAGIVSSGAEPVNIPLCASYEMWNAVGISAAEKAMDLLRKQGVNPIVGNLIFMTTAGYAEINGLSTQGSIDGAASVTKAERGRHTLIEIHAAPWNSLWFAVYEKSSGYCAYIEADPEKITEYCVKDAGASYGLFFPGVVERIDAAYLYQHAEEYEAKFKKKMFGGNEFRIITIANAVSAGASSAAVRAFEFHDHYCPGVTSGILMATYIKKHFPPGKNGYFIHSVDPWCKEDALMVILNATPGKKAYAVSYPSDADKALRIPEAAGASTVAYRKNDQGNIWEGAVLSFDWAETNCLKTGSGIIDKLCIDLWCLDHMDKPEAFVKEVKRFSMEKGASPMDWARPGTDPLTKLGLTVVK